MRISDWSSDVCSSDLFDRAPRYPDGARRGLDPRTLEGTHQLLEALPLRAAEQRVSGRTHRVELERIFAHAAIAEHPDRAAAHLVGGERDRRGTPQLRDEEPRPPGLCFGLRQLTRGQGLRARQSATGVPSGRAVLSPLMALPR